MKFVIGVLDKRPTADTQKWTHGEADIIALAGAKYTWRRTQET
jgi:hypothetical protein